MREYIRLPILIIEINRSAICMIKITHEIRRILFHSLCAPVQAVSKTIGHDNETSLFDNAQVDELCSANRTLPFQLLDIERNANPPENISRI